MQFVLNEENLYEPLYLVKGKEYNLGLVYAKYDDDSYVFKKYNFLVKYLGKQNANGENIIELIECRSKDKQGCVDFINNYLLKYTDIPQIDKNKINFSNMNIKIRSANFNFLSSQVIRRLSRDKYYEQLINKTKIDISDYLTDSILNKLMEDLFYNRSEPAEYYFSFLFTSFDRKEAQTAQAIEENFNIPRGLFSSYFTSKNTGGKKTISRKTYRKTHRRKH